MPLNYSKWDQLELSDDSDIEGHPNVDKKSLIRWKQRDIHEKREKRKYEIVQMKAQIACNKVLLPRITEISNNLKDTSASPPRPAYFNNLYESMKANPSKDCPPGNDPSKLEHTYDGMILSLLQQVGESARNKLGEEGVSESEREEKLTKLLADGMAEHVQRLGETIEQDTKKLEAEENEQKKKITMDDLHEGFESKYQPAKPTPTEVPRSKIEKPKKKEHVTEFETLNTPKSDNIKATQANTTETDDEDEEGLPELTTSLLEFSRIPVKAYERSFNFLQSHRDVFIKGASDSLLVAAFRAQSDGKSKYAKQCIHQSLLLQYCDKLGPDGVAMFFKKMIAGDKRAEKVFVDDVENTYRHLVQRVEITKQEQAAESEGQEQIQLVAESPDTKISFNVPDGPPPGNLVLEGPGTEDLDIEEVRKALQLRWDVFCGFPQDFQDALKDGSLEKVNDVLGKMEIPVAEQVVQSLDLAGILSFAEGGIRDETSAGRAAAEASSSTQ